MQYLKKNLNPNLTLSFTEWNHLEDSAKSLGGFLYTRICYKFEGKKKKSNLGLINWDNM